MTIFGRIIKQQAPRTTMNKEVDLPFFQLKVHKIENFFDSDFEICIISLLVMSKY